MLFLRAHRASGINEELFHRARNGSEEVASRLPGFLPLARDLQEHFAHDHRSLKVVRIGLIAHGVDRHGVHFAMHRSPNCRRRLNIAIHGAIEQERDVRTLHR